MNADNKKTCFVIFPFKEPYESRVKNIYKPALEDADLIVEIAGDHGTNEITAEIEEKIRESFICFADITEDNLNVWYEVGYAYGCDKNVVLVCNEEVRKLDSELPFDIQHKKVIGYSSADENFYAECGREVTADAKAKMKKAEQESVLGNKIPENFTPEDIDILGMIVDGRDFGVIAESFKNKKLSIIRLKSNGYIITIEKEFKISEEKSRKAAIYFPTEKAIKFKENNPDLFSQSPKGWKKEKADIRKLLS